MAFVEGGDNIGAVCGSISTSIAVLGGAHTLLHFLGVKMGMHSDSRGNTCGYGVFRERYESCDVVAWP
jgi:hypothetical protein